MSEIPINPGDEHRAPSSDDSLPVLNRLQGPALVVGIAGIVVLVIGLLISREAFFTSYLLGYVFWVGVSLGCFALLMLQHLTGGAWGLVIRRILESGAWMLPLMAVLFIPLALPWGMYWLYPWTHEDHHLPWFKAWYLQEWFFIVRTVVYFAIWIGLMLLLSKWSADQDRTGDPYLVRRMQLISGPGLVLYVLTVTLAATDWVMSLNPHWFSTIFGFLFVVSQALSTMALVIALVVMLGDRAPLRNLLSPGLYNDLGNLLMAFTMLWAYISLSQYLIIWSGNMTEETPYYYFRSKGWWALVAIVLIVFHFFVPFLLLLWRKSKRNPRALAAIAGWILVMRFVDLYWLIEPSVQMERIEGGYTPETTLGVGWVDIPFMLAAIAGIGGVFVFLFVRRLKGRPILPVHDPRLAELEASHHHG